MADTPPALWLWCDCETTGLLDTHPAVLEIAWMVTDSDLTQFTPLRQRLCALPWRPSWPQRLTAWSRFRRAVPDLLTWPLELMSAQADMMHINSGLAGEWRRCADHVRDVARLDCLLMADVAAATARLLAGVPPGGEPPPIVTHLAGAGVAQFESRLLPGIGSIVLDVCHYRCVDTSVAAAVAGVPKVTEPDPDDGLDVDAQDGVVFPAAVTQPHRAAADVRAAYRQARDLRALVSEPTRLTRPQGHGPMAD